MGSLDDLCSNFNDNNQNETRTKLTCQTHNNFKLNRFKKFNQKTRTFLKLDSCGHCNYNSNEQFTNISRSLSRTQPYNS